MANLEVSRAERLDMRVVAMHPDLTRSAAARLIAEQKVAVNGAVIEKAGHKLRAGDVVTVTYDRDAMTAIPHIDLPILYEDDDCVVIEKPAGVLTHSKGRFNPEATVGSWLGEHLVALGQRTLLDLDKDVASGSPHNPRAGIVHRLDRATSGVLICAKTPAALAWLQKQFSQRRTKKTYIAIVEGHLHPQAAVIDIPIERNPRQPQTFRVGTAGKPAQTHYRVLQSGRTADLVELAPVTGRTHQLRVHMQHVGHPIIGDPLYGKRSDKRLYLHALSLEITLPNRQRSIFTAPLPAAFTSFINGDD